MMKRILAFIVVSMLLLQLHAQIISNVDWEQKGQQIEISYDLTSPTPGQTFDVSVYVSKDGGISFLKEPLALVRGDVGKAVKEGIHKKIIWEALEEMPDFGGIVVFDVRAAVKKVTLEKEFFAGYKGSCSVKSITAPLGLVVGRTGKPGYYLSGRLNARYFEKTIDNDGLTPPAGYDYVPEVIATQRLSITAGAQFQVGMRMHIYAGGGITSYSLLWQAEQGNSTQWLNITDKSFSSYEIEAGIMFQIKHIFLSAGITSYNKAYSDITFSGGIVF